MCKWHPRYKNESKANDGCFIFYWTMTFMLHCTNVCIAICSFHHHQLFVCTKYFFFVCRLFFTFCLVTWVWTLGYRADKVMNKSTSQKHYCVLWLSLGLRYIVLHNMCIYTVHVYVTVFTIIYGTIISSDYGICFFCNPGFRDIRPNQSTFICKEVNPLHDQYMPKYLLPVIFW